MNSETIKQEDLDEDELNSVSNSENVMCTEFIKVDPCSQEVHVKEEPIDDDISIDDTKISLGAIKFENDKLEYENETADSIISCMKDARNITDEFDGKIESDTKQLYYMNYISPLTVNQNVNIIKAEVNTNLENRTCFKQNNKCDRQIKRTVYKCQEFGYQTKHKGQMNRHLTVHDDARPYKCTLCHRKFKRKYELKRHGLMYCAVKNFECAHCEFKTNYRNDFIVHLKKKHKKTHLLKQNKKYKCTQCNYQADLESILKRHVYVHDNEKPYVCNKCEQSFAQKVQLQRHIGDKHVDEKQYRCLKCNYKSNSKYHFKRHLIIHEDCSGAYKCNICNKKFKRSDRLKVHFIVHSEKKKFSCKYCDYKSNFEVWLEKHLKNKHNQMLNK